LSDTSSTCVSPRDHSRPWLADKQRSAKHVTTAHRLDHPVAPYLCVCRSSKVETGDGRRLLKAAGFELHMQLAPYDNHDDVLREQEQHRSPEERQAWEDYKGARDRQPGTCAHA
jgi:hypothetical protein